MASCGNMWNFIHSQHAGAGKLHRNPLLHRGFVVQGTLVEACGWGARACAAPLLFGRRINLECCAACLGCSLEYENLSSANPLHGHMQGR